MVYTNTRSIFVAALLALSATACGTTAEPEVTPDPVVVEVPPPPVVEPPAAPTAETFPVAADFAEEATTTITIETLETELAALEAEDLAEQ